MTNDTAPQRLAAIVASRPLVLYPALDHPGLADAPPGWVAILSYAHHTTLPVGEIALPVIDLMSGAVLRPRAAARR